MQQNIRGPKMNRRTARFFTLHKAKLAETIGIWWKDLLAYAPTDFQPWKSYVGLAFGS